MNIVLKGNFIERRIKNLDSNKVIDIINNLIRKKGAITTQTMGEYLYIFSLKKRYFDNGKEKFHFILDKPVRVDEKNKFKFTNWTENHVKLYQKMQEERRAFNIIECFKTVSKIERYLEMNKKINDIESYNACQKALEIIKKELEEKAYILGKEAYRKGMESMPVINPEIRKINKILDVPGSGINMFKNYIKGWTEESLKNE